MFQQITLIGHLGSDVQMRYTPAGLSVANFSVATSKTYKSAEGEKQEKTTWWRVTVWRAQADNCAQYLGKGDKVLLVGELEEARTFVDRDGNNRVSLEFTAEKVKFLTTQAEKNERTGNGGPAQQRPKQQRPAQNQDRVPTQQELVEEEQIPF